MRVGNNYLATNAKQMVSMAIVIVCTIFTGVSAQSPESSSYRVDEYFIGPGGENDTSSANYDARASLGDTGIGNSKSASYQLYGGFTTTNDPHLELTVTASFIDFGELDASTTEVATADFSVRSYLSSGYSVTTSSPGPVNEDGYLLSPIATSTTSASGVEQFGMNLVANTSPTTFGLNPVQIPSTDYSYGSAATGYSTANNFQYNDGDTVAESSQSTGQTDYTISYIMNISPNTPAGVYNMTHLIIATPTF